MNSNWDEQLGKLATKYNFSIKNRDLYIKAFTHTSYANEHKSESNERLEFLGDAILDFLVGEYLYKKYPDMPEGEMSKARSTFVCEKANSEYSLILGLDECLLLGKGEEEQGGRSKTSVLGDLFESFLGAVYLEHGMDKIREIISDVIFSVIIYIDEDGFFEDYKSTLQEYIQAESRKGVLYKLDNEQGPSHDKTFTTSVYHDSIRLGQGIGKSKKESEQMAAKNALEKLVKI